MKRKTVGGSEVDAFDEKTHHHHNWKAGQRSAIKAGASRRERREQRAANRAYHRETAD